MRGFASVFMFEFRLRRAVFPAALVTGLIPIPMALLITQGASFSETVNVGAAAFALIGGELLALYLGATVLCQDLSEGRQGFYFSRPVGALALWAGKFSAAWAVVLGAMLVCLLPATFLGGGLATINSMPNPFSVCNLGPQELSLRWTPLFVALVLLGFMAMAHALSVMFRARSPWLILDAIMVVLLPALVWWALRRVLIWESEYLFLIEVAILGVGTLLGLLAAGGVQTSVGRSDLKRGHRALSLTLWTFLALTVLAVDAHALWATSVSPADLARIEGVEVAPAGPWMVLSGPLKHRGPDGWASFLANVQSGTWLGLQTSRWSGPVAFSPDGSMAVFHPWHREEGATPTELVSIDLTGEGAEPRPTGILLSVYDTTLVFAPDGSRLAVVSGTHLSIYDMPDWKLAATQRVERHADSWSMCRMYFMDPNTLRLSLSTEKNRSGSSISQGVTDLFEFSIPTRKLTQTGTVAGAQPWSPRVSAAGDRMLVIQDNDGAARLLLCNARTGEVLKPLSSGVGRRSGMFLWDGRILVSQRTTGNPSELGAPRKITLFSADGVEVRAVEVDGNRLFMWAAQVEPTKVLAYTWQPGTSSSVTGEVRLFDTETGVVKTLPGLRPVAASWNPSQSPRLDAAPENVGTQIFLDSQGKLVLYDFKTGTTSPVKF